MAQQQFEDKVVVITGGAGGIGSATAEIAVAGGATVVVQDLRPERVTAAVDRLRSLGGNAIGIAGDVGQPEQVRANVDQIMREAGRIDVLVNNAAINTYHDTETMPFDMWQRELNVVLTGQFLWAQATATATMIPNRRGSIVNVGSGAALGAIPRCVAYVAAKHGVVGLTKALAIDWGRYNIRVNCVAPGLTFTELAKASARANPEAQRQRLQRIPIGRGAQPEDVARAILFLASDGADAVSGVVLPVDGGNWALHSGYTAARQE